MNITPAGAAGLNPEKRLNLRSMFTHPGLMSGPHPICSFRPFLPLSDLKDNREALAIAAMTISLMRLRAAALTGLFSAPLISRLTAFSNHIGKLIIQDRGSPFTCLYSLSAAAG